LEEAPRKIAVMKVTHTPPRNIADAVKRISEFIIIIIISLYFNLFFFFFTFIYERTDVVDAIGVAIIQPSYEDLYSGFDKYYELPLGWTNVKYIAIIFEGVGGTIAIDGVRLEGIAANSVIKKCNKYK
jgi:hypothetical protein